MIDYIIFHRPALKLKLTASEKIIYLYLVNLAVLLAVGSQSERQFYPRQETVRSYLEYSGWHDVVFPKVEDMARDLGLSRMSVYRALKRLQDQNYIYDGKVYVKLDFFKHGYFQLPTPIPRRYELHIVYHALKDLTKPYNGVLDAKKCNLEQYLGYNREQVKKVLQALVNNKLATRIVKGVYKIK